MHTTLEYFCGLVYTKHVKNYDPIPKVAISNPINIGPWARKNNPVQKIEATRLVDTVYKPSADKILATTVAFVYGHQCVHDKFLQQPSVVLVSGHKKGLELIMLQTTSLVFEVKFIP